MQSLRQADQRRPFILFALMSQTMDACWMYAFLVIWLVLHVTRSCDPNFKAIIEDCTYTVKVFLTFQPEEMNFVSSFPYAETVCRQDLVKTSSDCVAKQYSLCPRAAVYRTQCGFQMLQPDIMRNHSDIVCKNLEAFKKNVNCFQQRNCTMKTCMTNFDQHMPSRLSSGMWKTPKYRGECRLYSYLLHCFEKSFVGYCDVDSVNALQQLLFLYRPASCLEAEVAALKDSFSHISNTASSSASSLIHAAAVLGVSCLLVFRTTILV